MYVVEDFGVGEIVVKSEVARDFLIANLVDQLDAQVGMIDEGFFFFGAAFLSAETAKIQGIVLAAGTNVIGKKIILSDLVTLFGMVPHIRCIGDEFAVMVDQDIVNGDDAVVGIACGRILLQEFEATGVEFVGIPVRVREETVEAGLVRGLGELVVDAEDGLAFSDVKASEVLGEVVPRIVGEYAVEIPHGLLDDRREGNDTWHGITPLQLRPLPIVYRRSCARAMLCHFAKLQLEDINRVLGAQADRFLEKLPPPPPAKEGTLLVTTADGKGVPLVRQDLDQVPAFDQKERPGNRRMATLGCVYTVAPYVRTPEQIVAALFRDDTVPQPPDRPEACHKHYRAYFAVPASASEEALPSVFRTWTWLAEEVAARCQPRQPIIPLMDGQPSLREAAEICLEDFIANRQPADESVVVDILDIIHVSGYVWKTAKVFHSHKEHQEAFAQDRLLRILRGEVAGVIRGMRRMASERGLKGSALKEVNTACNYFENNSARMRYHEYLEAGYPIASGVIEGACRHIIKDRMEHGGMRWTLQGAQAMLDVRCVSASSEWDNFNRWRQAEQAERVHPFRAVVTNYRGFRA